MLGRFIDEMIEERRYRVLDHLQCAAVLHDKTQRGNADGLFCRHANSRLNKFVSRLMPVVGRLRRSTW